MKPLPEQPIEVKALNTAAMLFAAIGLLVALAYIDVSHVESSGYLITPRDIADAYYGPGMSINTLIGLAHIHMFGLLSVFWVIGYIFVHSTISRGWRVFWSVLPYIAFLTDVAGWFLTHYFEYFVYEVIAGGTLFVLSLTVMILVSLYQMWVTPWRTRRERAVAATSLGER